jgi:hypothetical protein
VFAVQVVVTLAVVGPLAGGGLPRWVQVLVVALVSIGLRVLLGALIARRVLAGGGTGAVPVRSVALGAAAGYLLTVLAGWVLVEAPGSAGVWLGELVRTVVGLAVTAAPFAAGARWQAVRSEAPAAAHR